MPRRWSDWWDWDLESSPHLRKRMIDRGFAEVDLCKMVQVARRYRRDVVDYRWVVETRHLEQAWEVIFDPDPEAKRLVVVTAYQ